jgi:polyhydroxyalkanoate synthesis regulator phasin
VNEGLQRYLDLASSLTRTTLGTTERVLAGFVRQGEVAAEQAERLLDEIIARSVDSSGALARLVATEVEQAVERAGYVRAEEVQELRREVDGLRAKLAAVNGDSGDADTESL